MHKKLFVLIVGALLLVRSPLAAQTLPPELVRYADVVLYNGKVLTADDKFSTAEAVAIRDGKFLKVGNTRDILPLAGPSTKKVDLEGRTVVPGFFDTHLHGA